MACELVNVAEFKRDPFCLEVILMHTLKGPVMYINSSLFVSKVLPPRGEAKLCNYNIVNM